MNQPSQHLISEVLKRATVVWVAAADGSGARAAWCAAHDATVYVASGGDEQPTPPALVGVTEASGVRVLLRSRETRQLLIDAPATASVVAPTDHGAEDAWRAANAARLHGTLAPESPGVVLHRLTIATSATS